MNTPTRASTGQSWQQPAELFGRWRDGDLDALNQLVRLTTPRLSQLVRGYGLEQHTAEDVVQTAWMALVQHRDSIERSASILAWLTTTTRREAWHAARLSARTVVTDLELFDSQRLADGAEQEAQAAWEIEHLWETVGRLPHPCQRLLRVIAFEDRPGYRRMARELDMPVGSLGPTRGRCLDKLRLLLGNGQV
ncbi:MAG: RNA polymerase sigma factor [Nocardioidaceae bacterium]